MDNDLNIKVVVGEVENAYSNNGIKVVFPNDDINLIGDLSNITNNDETISKGGEPFLFGTSRLGGGDRFYKTDQKYQGYLSASKAHAFDGKFEAGSVDKFSFTVTGNQFDCLVIEFDALAKQWATEIVIGERTYYNTGARFIWTGTAVNELVITIKKWNTPGYPVRITSISDRLNIVWRNDCIEELTRGYQCTADNTKIEFGFIGQYGSITVRDINYDLMELAQNNLFKKNMPVTIYMGDRIIGKYTADDWKYDFKANKLKVQLVDELSVCLQNAITEIVLNEYVLLKGVLLNLLDKAKFNGTINMIDINEKEFDLIALYAYYSDCQTMDKIINDIVNCIGANCYYDQINNKLCLIEI